MTEPPIRLLIVDDEAPAREKLSRYVAQCPRFSLVGEARDGQEALDAISRFAPQIILLDIQMPGMSGFDLLRLLDNQQIAVIFTTAYDHYAIAAFEVSAVDYLLKPINFNRLEQALGKAAKHLSLNWPEKINQLLQQVAGGECIQRLPVRQGQQIKILAVQQICFIRSEHRLVHIYDHSGQKYWTNESLTQLAQRLDPRCFMRIHRNGLVNLTASFAIKSYHSGRLKLLFDFAQETVISREHVSAFKTQFGL
jgi:two-component system LytT family response regulator